MNKVCDRSAMAVEAIRRESNYDRPPRVSKDGNQTISVHRYNRALFGEAISRSTSKMISVSM